MQATRRVMVMARITEVDLDGIPTKNNQWDHGRRSTCAHFVSGFVDNFGGRGAPDLLSFIKYLDLLSNRIRVPSRRRSCIAKACLTRLTMAEIPTPPTRGRVAEAIAQLNQRSAAASPKKKISTSMSVQDAIRALSPRSPNSGASAPLSPSTLSPMASSLAVPSLKSLRDEPVDPKLTEGLRRYIDHVHTVAPPPPPPPPPRVLDQLDAYIESLQTKSDENGAMAKGDVEEAAEYETVEPTEEPVPLEDPEPETTAPIEPVVSIETVDSEIRNALGEYIDAMHQTIPMAVAPTQTKDDSMEKLDDGDEQEEPSPCIEETTDERQEPTDPSVELNEQQALDVAMSAGSSKQAAYVACIERVVSDEIDQDQAVQDLVSSAFSVQSEDLPPALLQKLRAYVDASAARGVLRTAVSSDSDENVEIPEETVVDIGRFIDALAEHQKRIEERSQRPKRDPPSTMLTSADREVFKKDPPLHETLSHEEERHSLLPERNPEKVLESPKPENKFWAKRSRGQLDPDLDSGLRFAASDELVRRSESEGELRELTVVEIASSVEMMDDEEKKEDEADIHSLLIRLHADLCGRVSRTDADTTEGGIRKLSHVVWYTIPFFRGRMPLATDVALVRKEGEKIGLSTNYMDQYLRFALASRDGGHDVFSESNRAGYIASMDSADLESVPSDELLITKAKMQALRRAESVQDYEIARLFVLDVLGKARPSGDTTRSTAGESAIEVDVDEGIVKKHRDVSKTEPELPWWEAPAQLGSESAGDEAMSPRDPEGVVSFEEDYVFSGSSCDKDSAVGGNPDVTPGTVEDPKFDIDQVPFSFSNEEDRLPDVNASASEDMKNFWSSLIGKDKARARGMYPANKGPIPGVQAPAFSRQLDPDNGLWARRNEMAMWRPKKDWRGREEVDCDNEKPPAVHGTEAAMHLYRPLFHGNLRNGKPVSHHWRLSYIDRCARHSGYTGLDIFSFTESNIAGPYPHRYDALPWELRDVKQFFLFEQSLAEKRNWFGTLKVKERNHHVRFSSVRPHSMKMPSRTDPWNEEWYKQPQLIPDTDSRTTLSLSAIKSTREREERARLEKLPVRVFEEDDESSLGENPECGTFRNVELKIGERITRVTPDLTCSLRRSRWRKKHFPKGTFPY